MEHLKYGYFLAIFIILFHKNYGYELTQKCEEDWNIVLASVNISTEEWAQRMFDSNGKSESGQISGNIVFEGDYQQCKSVVQNKSEPNSIKGLYCVTYWFRQRRGYKTRGFGYCIPDTCTDNDARNLSIQINEDSSLFPVPPTEEYLHCARPKDVSGDPAAIVSIVILCLFGAVTLASTMFEILYIQKKLHPPCKETSDKSPLPETKSNDVELNNVQLNVSNQEEIEETVELRKENDNPSDIPRKRFVQPRLQQDGHVNETSNNKVNMTIEYKPGVPARLLLSFSLYTNVPRLLDAKHVPGNYECLNGFRFLTMSWIILGHTYQLPIYLTDTPTVENRFTIADMISRPQHEAINSMWVAVETFFIISGMLVTLSFMKTIKKQGNRLTVRHLVLFYFHRYWRLTPVYMIVMMFYANIFNYLGDGPLFIIPPDSADCKTMWWRKLLYIDNLFLDGKTCMAWTWYLAIDFQLYVCVPLFAGLAYLALHRKKTWLGGMILILGYVGSLGANIVINALLQTGKMQGHHSYTVYIKPWCRATSYFLGMLLGYVIYTTKRKVKMHKVLVGTGWFIAFCLITICLYAKTFDNPAHPWTVAGDVTFTSLQSGLFAFAVCWMIFACLHGYGGIVNTILSWNAFVPLARLTYVGYLIHPIFIVFYIYTSPKQIYLYDWFLINLYFGYLVSTMACAFIVTLVFEIPMLGLEKVLIPRK